MNDPEDWGTVSDPTKRLQEVAQARNWYMDLADSRARRIEKLEGQIAVYEAHEAIFTDCVDTLKDHIKELELENRGLQEEIDDLHKDMAGASI